MKKTLLLFSAVMPGASCCLLAANNAPADSSVYNLDDVVVLATRANNTTPIAFTNVSSGQLSDNNDGLDIPYLLQFTPSVITTSDAGTGIG